jgi:hypothetical protein
MTSSDTSGVGWTPEEMANDPLINFWAYAWPELAVATEDGEPT